MATVELCYMTARGAGVVRYLHDVVSTEKALKALHKRHIEANLYVSGERDANGNRTKPVGGVMEAPGQLWNGRYVQWNWWFDPAMFEPALPGPLSRLMSQDQVVKRDASSTLKSS